MAMVMLLSRAGEVVKRKVRRRETHQEKTSLLLSTVRHFRDEGFQLRRSWRCSQLRNVTELAGGAMKLLTSQTLIYRPRRATQPTLTPTAAPLSVESGQTDS